MKRQAAKDQVVYMTENKEFFMDTVWNDFTTISKLNLMTGEHIFIHGKESQEQNAFSDVTSLDKYIHVAVDDGLIHPNDVDTFLIHMDLAIMQEMFLVRHCRRLVSNFRSKSHGEYRWTTAEIILPKNFTLEAPWVLCTWRAADKNGCSVEDAMRILTTVFYKILKINLTDDTHEEIKVPKNELSPQEGFSKKISVWFSQFAYSEHVHPDDMEEYLKFTDLSYLRDYFRQGNDSLLIRYRRKVEGLGWRYVSLELLPSVEYTHDRQILMLYIRDIHNTYAKEIEQQKQLEFFAKTDSLTGLKNRNSYILFVEQIQASDQPGPMGLLFADLNGLKYVNDTYGHAEGDELIKQMAGLLSENFRRESCYRIGGDEFVVTMQGIPRDVFQSRCSSFRQSVHSQYPPIASIGYAWREACSSMDRLLKDAELEMYRDKEYNHRVYPEFMRH